MSSAGERGLLGVAFDPNFASNRFVYVYYTATTPAIHNRVSRFTASATNPNVAQAGSETVLLELNNLSSATNHNGGAIHFGPDGRLYVAVGENANRNNAQTLSNLLGKMLRINSDGSIPTDNPFFNQATGVNRAIWALGLRNPFNFAFQPGTGRMLLNDVGEVTWEEINDGIAGSNYGWPMTEGPTTQAGIRAPLFAYQHGSSSTTGCAITGAAFYNPPAVQFPSTYVGRYFFADFCSGWIRTFTPSSGTAAGFATGLSSVVDLKVHADGSLFYLQRGGSPAGQVHRVRFAQNQAPSITQHPANLTVAAGQQATFTVAASGSQPLGFQWQRNGSNIAGATSPTLSFTAASADNGAMFRSVVTNCFGTATSNSATLTVSGGAPTATHHGARAGATYAAGTNVSFGGTGTDPQDGTLPASAFTWEVVFHHDTHTHPFFGPQSGITSGTVSIPNRGEVATNVFLSIPPHRARLRRAHARGHAGSLAAHVDHHARFEPHRVAALARRNALHRAASGAERRRHDPDARRHVAADIRGHDVQLAIVVRRRCRHARNHGARDEHAPSPRTSAERAADRSPTGRIACCRRTSRAARPLAART